MALSYASLAEFKLRIGVTGTSQDAELTALLEGVESLINAYLGFNPTTSSFTEYHDTRGTQTIALKRWPISTITSVHEDTNGQYGQRPGAFPASSELIAGQDYSLVTDNQSRMGVLYRIGRYWPRNLNRWPMQLVVLPSVCPGCVKVVYSVDNSEVLNIAKQAALLEGTAQYRSQLTGTGILTSDSMDGASVGISPFPNAKSVRDSRDNFFSPAVANMLRPFSSNARFV